MELIAGIDLGTTNSAVTLFGPKQQLIVVPNRRGERLTPSAVRFLEDGQVVVGEPAMRAKAADPRHTITGVKRLLGRYFNEVLDLVGLLSYEVVRDEHDLAAIRVRGVDYPPEHISALVLRSLIDDAEAYSGERITKAVIGVPAYFTDRQRAATKDAAEIAGLTVMRLVAEPTLAALFYGLRGGNQHVVVLDLGGGTFDVSVLEVGEGIVEVKAVSGDNFLGGNDFDYALSDWLINESALQTGRTLRLDPTMQELVLDAVTAAKIQLSTVQEAEISLPYLVDRNGRTFPFQTMLSREKLDSICAGLFDRLRAPCAQVLSDTGLSPQEIGHVLLVGGATRMPGVLRFAHEFFGKEPSHKLNPDEAIALGAGAQASILSGHVKDALLLDTTPLTLGVESADGTTIPVIGRNTAIPTRKSEVFSTALDNQTSVEIRVVQGESALASANRTIGRIVLEGLEAALAGTADIEVTFDIDANGLLNVSARDRAGGVETKMTARPFSGLTSADIARLRASVKATDVR